MPTVTVHQAKTHLSQLIQRALRGEEIIIARGKTPVVRIQPLAPKVERKFGAMKGRARVDDSFFDPLPDEELALWEGKG